MVGKKYSATMSDHTKVGEYKNEKTGVVVKDLMGGVFYPYIRGVRDAGLAWASVTTKAAREMIMNAVDQDYTLIYRMARATGSRGNVNFNQIAFDEFIAPVANGKVTEKEFLKKLNNKLNTISNGTQLSTGRYILGKYGVDTNEKIKINKTEVIKVKNKKGKLVNKTVKVLDKNGKNVLIEVPKKALPSLKVLKEGLAKESFSKRGGFWSTILKDSYSKKSTGEWYKFLEEHEVTSLEEIVNNLAEPEVDSANDHDIVAAIKIAPPEYDKNGNVKIYTTNKKLVNEAKGVYFIDAPSHPSYPYVVKGMPVGIFNEFNPVTDYFPVIAKWIKEERLNSPYKAIETMGKELVETLEPSKTTFATKGAKFESKAQIVHDETGFISVPSMIEIVKSNDPSYLGGVMEHIQNMGEKLKSGKVTATDLGKAYLMAVSSIRSGDIGLNKFESAIGEKVDPVFVEPGNKIRTEGAMAYLMTTDKGKDLLKHASEGKILDSDIQFVAKAMKPFGMFGAGESKSSNLFGAAGKDQINLTNIKEFESLLKGGVKDEKQFFDAITKLKGISQAKVGFVSNFLGLGTRGVIDAREIQGWLRGAIFQGVRTAKEAEIEKQLTKSNKQLSPLQNEILKRMRQVGDAFGIDPAISEYIGHHMIWDAVAKEKTTHDGLYLAMSQNENEFADKLAKYKSKSQILGVTGAARLSNASKVVEDLKYAKEMEQNNKTPKEIKLATSWEKGIDGKWRLEVPDAKLKDPNLTQLSFAAFEDDYFNEEPTVKLKDFIVDPELFKAYDYLNSIKITFSSKYSPSEAAYSPNMGTIYLSKNEDVGNVLPFIIHEVQHVIQFREEFPRGGTPDNVRQMVESKMRMLSSVSKDLQAKLQSAAEKNDFDLYFSLAGEVEARNAQRRLSMSPEERLETLLADTEDVAREDQVLLGQASNYFMIEGEQALASVEGFKASEEGKKAAEIAIKMETAMAKAPSLKAKQTAKLSEEIETLKSENPEKAEVIDTIVNNIDAIRAQLLEAGIIESINCKWG